MDGRTCARCGEAKTIAQMAPDKRCLDGVRRICRRCEAARVKAWKSLNPEKVKRHKKPSPASSARYAARWYAKNRERQCAYVKEWQRKHPEVMRAKSAKKQKKQIATVHPQYAKKLLSRSGIEGIRIPYGLIPAELVQAKVLEIKISRLLKEIKQ